LNSGFFNMKALSPTGISRPFDVARDGFCSAEAAAVLVLEEYEAAKARGATIYAEIAGTGSTADANHITAPSPQGAGAIACMRAALDDAGVPADEVTHVNAHGTSTPLNDAAEAIAVEEVFGSNRPAVTSIKGITGHSLGAAGAVEAATVALTYRHREIPPTMHVTEVDPALDIDVVLESRSWDPAPAVSNSFAFGGHNGSLVFRPI
jgi:3-oxoacyl-[acyl-carrier-protein] synthase II